MSESVHGWAARTIALGYTTIIFLAAETLKVAPIAEDLTAAPASSQACRENILCVAAVVRQMQPHAHFAWDAGVPEVEQQSTNRILFLLELETAIQLPCHIDYWNCLCIVLHSFVFDDLNSM